MVGRFNANPVAPQQQQQMPDQQELLMRVLSLTPLEIQNLPVEQQAQVLQLKQQFLGKTQ